MEEAKGAGNYEACLAAIQAGELATARLLLQPFLTNETDAEALRLLALIQVRQGEPVKAVATLQKALEIEQNAILLANLANALAYAGDLAKAESTCYQALAIEALPEVHNTLGSLLAMRKAYQKAIDSFESALRLRPGYTQACCNLINAYLKIGNIECAFEGCLRLTGCEVNHRQFFEGALTAITDAITCQPSLGIEAVNTVKELMYLVLPAREWSRWSGRITGQAHTEALHYEEAICTAISHWLKGQSVQLDQALNKAASIREKGIRSSKGLKSLAAYESYLIALKQMERPVIQQGVQQAVVLGDSHVLSWNGQAVAGNNYAYKLEAELIMGAKAFHIADAAPNRFLWRLRQMLKNTPPSTPLIFSFGEIDCRVNEGILPFIQKTGSSLVETVQTQANAYAKALRELLPKECPAAWVIGVPAPNIASLQMTFRNADAGTYTQHKEIIRQWNSSLQEVCQQLALGFVDVYGLTVGADGASNQRWYCDGVHLRPEALKAAKWIAPQSAETPELLNSQGAQLANQKQYAAAEKLFHRALALRPDYADARINLSAVQFLGCQPEQAWETTLEMLGYSPQPLSTDAVRVMGARILQEGFDGQVGQFNTLKEIAYNCLPSSEWDEWNQLLSRPRNRADLCHEGAVRQAITAWLQKDQRALRLALTNASELHGSLPENKSTRNLVAYENYLAQLSKHFPKSKHHRNNEKIIRMHALGDSHVLSWHGLMVRKNERTYKISSELVMGAKAFHIASPERNHFQDRLARMLARVPTHVALLLSCGEIDCRLTEGLLPYLQKNGQAMKVLVAEQVTRYVRSIVALVAGRWQDIWLTGVPAPLHEHLRLRHPDFDEATWRQHADLIRQWNTELATACAGAGFGFIDVYALTAKPDGTSNGQWHCDSAHLLPKALTAARWRAAPVFDMSSVAKTIEAGNTALAQNRLCEAERLYRQVISRAPNIPEAHNNLGTVLKEQGCLAEASAAYERALDLRPDYVSAHSNLLFTLQYAQGQTLANLRIAHEDWARRHLQDITPNDQVIFERKQSGPIVVGLVSPDFYAHPVGVFLLPWLESRNQARFHLIAYDDSERDDPIARRIRAAVDRWRPIVGQVDSAVAKQIAEDKVDILIDLAGHTAGNRLKLFARRAAPVQITWLGYSSTTGVPAMDYILMDQYSAPAGYEGFFTEKLIRLDGLRFCYTPPPYAPAVSPAPTFTKSHITFGSFNNLAKITPEVIQTWAAILNAVPNSRLVLKWKSLGDVETRARLTAAFGQHGIEESRLECRGWSSHPAMLAEYGDIDVALDPFPFSGGLTSCDALYMGVPVITMPGELPISRQTGSFLLAMGLTEWIASDVNKYIERAVRLAKDASALAEARAGLRTRMLASRLCDGAAYARAIESVLTGMQSQLHMKIRPVESPSRDEQEQIVALYQQGRFAELEARARILTERYPLHPFGWEVLGPTLNQLGQYAGAEAAYRHALELMPDSVMTLSNFANFLNDRGKHEEALKHATRATELDPCNEGAWINRGRALQEGGQNAAARVAYQTALNLNPKSSRALNNLGGLAKAEENWREVVKLLHQAVEIEPNSAAMQCNLGLAYKELGETAATLACLHKSVALDPAHLPAHVALAELYIDKGEFQAAQVQIDQVLRIESHYALALAQVPKLRKMTPADGNWAQKVHRLLSDTLTQRERIVLHYALGKYDDDTKNYASAFAHYREANQLKRQTSPAYNCELHTHDIDRLIAAHPRDVIQQARPGASDSMRPLFIVGMPRSGTSLLEQILASHPKTYGAGELTFWSETVGRHSREALSAHYHESLLSQTVAACHVNLSQHSPDALRVVDKMPHNFLHLGFIHACFPEARILHAQRNPVDTCLSIYFQDFNQTHAYANDLDDLAHYYREYHRLMVHWRSVLPAEVFLDVPYEAVVEDQESWSRRIIEFIGLEWDERCLEYYKTERRVGTASNWQARQPIYKSSKERWRNYETFVGALLPLLELYDPTKGKP